MSDEMKNCCPPETTAPKMHAHEAGEKTEDIKPKVVTTAHKRLSQDEFQRKVAALAREKTALLPAVAAAAMPYVNAGLTAASIPATYYSGAGTKGTANYGHGALGGAGLGAGLGALYGLVNPGEDTEYDSRGNVIGKKRRGMLSGLVRGAMGGMGLGAAGGLAAEHLAPGTAGQLAANATSFGKRIGAQLGLRKPEYNRGLVGYGVENALAYNPATALPYWTGLMPKSLYRNRFTGTTE